MSVVILGGNECMERQYSNVCRKYGCKAKVFCKPCADMKSRIGTPDLLIVFTHTISHKMVQCALTGLCGETKIIRSHTSSMNSPLKENLQTPHGDTTEAKARQETQKARIRTVMKQPCMPTDSCA